MSLCPCVGAPVVTASSVSAVEGRHPRRFTFSGHPQTDASGGSRPGQNVSIPRHISVLPRLLFVSPEVFVFCHKMKILTKIFLAQNFLCL